MDWESPRTRPSFWTPSFPLLERYLPASSPVTNLYRALRLSYVALLLPLHLTLCLLSVLPLSSYLLPPSLYPGKLQRWTPPQRLVYPLLRRLIWAVCDVGSPGALTPPEEGAVPLWAEWLEEATVWLGGGKRVGVEVEWLEMPQEAREKGWIRREVLDPNGRIGFEKVPLFWFERDGARAGKEGESGEERWRARSENERVVLYFVGGGFVTGNPSEGSRCFKMARETGLRVVGCNFRKAVDPLQAFPAALQDALATYAYLTLTLGYRNIVLSGDSAGGGLALTLLQYLALEVPRAGGLVLPAGMLLFSPWCDLTASTYGESMKREYEDDIICASMATNSIRSYLLNVNSTPSAVATKARGGTLEASSVYSMRASHPWFSPSLPSALPALTSVARAYLPFTAPDDASPAALRNSHQHSHSPSPPSSFPLHFFITTGQSELFFPEVHALISTLRAASRSAAVPSSDPGAEPFVVEAFEAEGEVHAFPLVPEWISPAAGEAWRRIRRWAGEGL